MINMIKFYQIIYDSKEANMRTIIRDFTNYMTNERQNVNRTIYDLDNYDFLSQKFLRDLDIFYTLKPIMVFYGYFKFIFQVICLDENMINTNCVNILENLDKIILGDLNPGVRYINLFDLIKYCHHIIPDKIPINMPPSFI